MNNKAMEIKKRAFLAYRFILDAKLINRTEFCQVYDIERTHLYHIEKNRIEKIPLQFLHALVVDFGISADWIITGRGNMMEGFMSKAVSLKGLKRAGLRDQQKKSQV